MEKVEEINKLKKEKNAVILAHYYQNPEIQDASDFIGDSFFLAKKAKELTNDIIVFCGVRFMAESAKILNPKKKVLLPILDAGCPMADMVTVQDIENLKKQHPDAAVVTYVNSNADVKAVTDVCCTSSNAIQIVNSIPYKEIIFVPDKNLGYYISGKVNKRIILFDGYCNVHNQLSYNDVVKARTAIPNALLAVHPECKREVQDEADFIGSTAEIIEYINKSNSNTFIIGTEEGVLHTIKKNNPNKELHLLNAKLICPDMKKTTLNDLYKTLKDESNEVFVDTEISVKANKALTNMLFYGEKK